MCDKIEYKTWNEEVYARLDNRIAVDNRLLGDIVGSAKLPKCRLLLILDRENGFNGVVGISFAEKDLDLLTDRDRDRYVGKCNVDARNDWDYAVYIPRKTAETWSRYKLYFVLTLAHELEHVRVMLEELDFHRCTAWLVRYFEDVCQSAQQNIFRRICDTNKDEVPWESHCHRFGKHIALMMNCGEDFENQMRSFAHSIERHRPEHSEVVKRLLNLDCNSVENENLADIKNSTKEFCSEVRDCLVEVWNNERTSATTRGKLASRFNLESYI